MSKTLVNGPNIHIILVIDNLTSVDRYLILTLEKYVTMDYTLVYFHHGLTSSNKPPLAWLWGLYKVLDRNFKKNLKSLLIVHPTTFIGVVFNFFKPIIR